MLQIKDIHKQYKTGDLIQSALDGVSLNLRDNEFVAVLGPSGSGKTTLLNIIGGLDRYDSGDLVINNISTKKYKERDWDSYRNHTIGFVFQSYNLIPHQSVLANVELALTISGISKSERRRRAKEALAEVGLADQLHKKPNQMSGGQMQRVAIARALVNNPDILLADEPTGALDSETSVQVMELLKKVAKDRLVIMVTHNPELADQYANRIVSLRDGKIINDTNPFEVDTTELSVVDHKNMGKASMSFLTALSLSLNNLRTKKARTILTSFAGSIGIIGIALILSLSTGVNAYIDNLQKETMTSYPITIEAEAANSLGSIMMEGMPQNEERNHDLDAVYTNSKNLKRSTAIATQKNNLTKFKEYLDNPESEIHQYVGTNGIEYSYDIPFDTYVYDADNTLINTDGSTFKTDDSLMGRFSGMSFGSSSNFVELMSAKDGAEISDVVTDNYTLLNGEWPKAYDELVLLLDENNEMPTSVFYELGLLPAKEYKEILEKQDKGEEVTIEDHKWTYEELREQIFYLVPASAYYQENEKGLFENISSDKTKMEDLVKQSVPLKISGVARINEDAKYTFSGYIGYTKALSNHIIEYADNSAVIKAQEESPDVNVLNGMTFKPKDEQAKIDDIIEYLKNLSVSDKAKVAKEIFGAMYVENPEMAQQMLSQDESELAALLDNFLQDPDDKILLNLYDAYISPGSYEENMKAFGKVSLDKPVSINIYADRFEDKDGISKSIENYNQSVSEDDKIVYTDMVQLLMSSITTIVNVISYVLIAFVAVSLIVSSIMIGIITFISVLERTKEIGVLRAMGASKRNISQVFNAETFIVGFLSGLMGVGITLLLLIPGNAILSALLQDATVKASLPIISAVILVLLSMGLTLIAGLIPSRKAAKKDPVIALRSE